MKKALLFAPMGSVHRRFNKANIEALLELGFEVHLLANFEIGDGPEEKNKIFKNECEDKGIIIHSICFYRHSLTKNIKLIKEVKDLFKKEKFDLIHAHTETGGLLLRLSYKSAGKKCKLIYTPHGMSFYKGSSLISQLIYKPIEKWISEKMDCNLSMNAEEKYWFDKWGKERSFFVHGIGLDLNRFSNVAVDKDYLFKEFDIPQSSKVVCSVGELNNNKNHRVIIEAISKLKDKNNVYYLICGVGPLKEELEKQAKEKKVNLVLAGFRNDIPQVLSSADIFAFPSIHEGLPVSVMEAMASGTPVICSQIRGNVDLISQDNGIVCDADSASDFKKGLEFWISDPQLMKSYASKCYKDINFYSFDKVYEELIELYRGN